ncbi:MAG: hypothetical protein V3V10_10750 [Planctomycetota bacterium]
MKWILSIALMVAVAGCSGEANNTDSSAPSEPTETPKVEDKKVDEPVVEVDIYTMDVEEMT